MAKDFPTVVWRLKLLGFNAVRLPFSFEDLWNLPPKPLAGACAGVTPEAVVASTTAPPGAPAAGFTTAPPLSSAPGPGLASLAATGMGGACNAGLPGPPAGTTLDRFLWTVGYFTANGFYVMLDNQFNLDQTALRNPSLWVARWKELGARLAADQPASLGKVLVDLLNEPDAWGLAWEARGGKPGMTGLYLAAMDALDGIYPFLYVIEGCGQAGLAKNWGDGIATDAHLIASRGLSDPNPFFTTLLTKPYGGRVVAGPHIYGPSVARTTSDMTGPSFYKRLSQSFGYLNKAGYCPPAGGSCVRFPVLLGETGTGFLSWDDLQPQMDLAAYAMAGRPGGGPPNPAADDGLHNPLSGVFWWAWNANGEGAMGVVRNDWTAVDWNKVTWLEHVGLRPWWFGSGVATGPATGGDGGSVDSTVPVPAPLRVGGRAPVRAGAAPAAANASSSAPSLAFTGDLWEWGLTSGGLELGGSTADGQAGPPPPPPSPPPLPWVGPPPSAEAGGGGAAAKVSPPPRPLSTAGPLILGSAGVPVDLRAVTLPAGFTSSPPSSSSSLGALAADAVAGLARVGSLGFNAVKVPLDLGRVLAPGPASPPLPAGPCPGSGADAAALAAATLPPTVARSAWTVFPPLDVNASALAPSASSSCNAYLPSSSSLDRLVGLVGLAAQSGLYVILEDASGPAGAGLSTGSGGTLSPPAWVAAWATVAGAVAPAAAGRLAIRLAADPDVAGVGWVPGVVPPLGPGSVSNATSTHPGLGDLLLAAMDALAPSAQGCLFLVPGAGQAAGMGGITGAGYSAAVPGGGEASAAQATAAGAFLASLAAKPYARRALLSPAWQVPSARAGGAGAPPLPPAGEWAALEAAVGGLTHAHAVVWGALGGPPPPAQLVQATVALAGADGLEAAGTGSLSADAAALAAMAAWLQPTCGLPACAAAAAAGVASPGGGHTPIRSWVWDSWMEGGGGGAPGAPSSSSARAVLLLGAPQDELSSSPAPLPPVDWAVVAFLGGLGAVPWYAPPTPEWRGPPPARPDPAASLPPLDAAGKAPGGEVACVATWAVIAPGWAGNASSSSSQAVGVLSLTLTVGAAPAAATLTPPYTLFVRPALGRSYASLRALAGATDGALAPAGAALTASVGDPWARLWPGRAAAVSVAAVLEAGGGGGADPGAALAPGAVSVGGQPCRLVSAPAHHRQHAEGGGGSAGVLPPASLMQVVVAGG